MKSFISKKRLHILSGLLGVVALVGAFTYTLHQRQSSLLGVATNNVEITYKAESPLGNVGGATVPASCESRPGTWNNNGGLHSDGVNSDPGICQCVANLGASCSTSGTNACGQAGYGTIQCDGSCSASVPANPAGYGQACNSAANACGMTNPGTIGCNSACNAAVPSNDLCPPPTVNVSLTPTSIQDKGSFKLSYTSTNASSCNVSNAISWANAPTAFDWGTVSGFGGPDTKTWDVTCVSAYSPSKTASDSATLTIGAKKCTVGVCEPGCPQECGSCSDPAYAAAHPSSCGTDPMLCLDAAYAAAHKSVCDAFIASCSNSTFATAHADFCTKVTPPNCSDGICKVGCPQNCNPQPCSDGVCRVTCPQNCNACGDGICRVTCPQNCTGTGVTTQILDFTLSPKLIAYGANTTLKWKIKDPAGCKITNDSGLSKFPTITIPNASGEVTDTLLQAGITKKTTYTLTCGDQNQSATVSIYYLSEF